MTKYILLILAIIFAILTLRFVLTPPLEEPAIYPEPIDSEVLSSKVNSWRQENNISSLPEEESLCKYAEKRAEEIKTTWNHNQFQADQCFATNYGLCGENLAKDYYSEEETLQGWLNSPSHKDNLDDNWSAMCIRCSNGYCAQEFGKKWIPYK